MDDVYLGMLAKRLNVVLNNYKSHFLSEIPSWDLSKKTLDEKTALLLTSNISDIYFLYEANHFNHFWNIFLTNGSSVRNSRK